MIFLGRHERCNLLATEGGKQDALGEGGRGREGVGAGGEKGEVGEGSGYKQLWSPIVSGLRCHLLVSGLCSSHR